MKTIHVKSSKVAYAVAALALSIASVGAARANGIPTSTDEARAQSRSVATTQHFAVANQQASSTDEARALMGSRRQAPISLAVRQAIAASYDEARAAAVSGDISGRGVHTAKAASGLSTTGSGGE